MKINNLLILVSVLLALILIGCGQKVPEEKINSIRIISTSVNDRNVNSFEIHFETTGHTRDNQIYCYSDINAIRYPEDLATTNPTILGSGILTGRTCPTLGGCHIKVCCYPSQPLDDTKRICSENYIR